MFCPDSHGPKKLSRPGPQGEANPTYVLKKLRVKKTVGPGPIMGLGPYWPGPLFKFVCHRRVLYLSFNLQGKSNRTRPYGIYSFWKPEAEHDESWQSLDSQNKVQSFCFQNGACLVGELFPHPVGVFCTHLEPPNGHFSKNHLFSMIFGIWGPPPKKKC